MAKNLLITKKIKELLKNKNLTGYKLSKIIGISDGSMYAMIRGQAEFPADKIQKIAAVLEVSSDEINGWILADKCPENVLKRAIEVKQEVQLDIGMLILTTKIDNYLQQKGLSRTSLSKVIGYSQGKLNEMIKGVEPISPLVISKIAPVLEVTEDEIISWIVADKHSINALRVAVECLKG